MSSSFVLPSANSFSDCSSSDFSEALISASMASLRSFARLHISGKRVDRPSSTRYCIPSRLTDGSMSMVPFSLTYKMSYHSELKAQNLTEIGAIGLG